ncbi:CHAT domain-containing protein, partial [bacterium]|nr:CHAT domain-containing protein [bacterium]
IMEKSLSVQHPEVADVLNTMTRSFLLSGGEAWRKALPLIERAVATLESSRGRPDAMIEAYHLRAQLRRKNGEIEGAFSDLQAALGSIEELRPQVGASGESRASFFGQYKEVFDRIGDWQLAAGQVAKAMEVIERSRARVLTEQMAIGNIDLRNSIPAEVRSELLSRETAVKARLAEFGQRLNVTRSRKDLSLEEQLQMLNRLEDSLQVAEQDYQDVYKDIKEASPLLRHQITAGGEPIDLATVQKSLVPPKGLMFVYQIGKQASQLLIIPPSGDEPKWFQLEVSESEAHILQLFPGSLKSKDLHSVLLGKRLRDSEDGLLRVMSETPATITKSTDRQEIGLSDKLYALWRVLVPGSEWSRLVQCSEVIIIPDGVLHLLPFEALVIRPHSVAAGIRFWIDEGPIIRYAPSATTLHNLEQLPDTRVDVQASVLSLSDPVFDASKVIMDVNQDIVSKDPIRPTMVDSLDESFIVVQRESYERLGGRLVRLKNTAQETRSIRNAFSWLGDDMVVTLMRLDATESEVRKQMTNKKYIHLATHGLVDTKRSFLFSSLALTPPSVRTPEPSNDGFLQLHELYDLKLPQCELAVLSACKTNFGRFFEGEGVFALSRGFLAARARRVVASHWAVDDESTAELIGTFFEEIAEAERTNKKPDFSQALWMAKRRVRNTKQWSAPYHWAPFVLIGKGSL